MKVYLFYIALFLQLLVEMLPILPNFVTYVALFFFIVYLMSDGGIHISKEYFRWMVIVFGFFSLSVIWAIDWKIAAWKLVYGLFPVLVVSIATYNFLVRTTNGIRKVLWIYLVAAGILLMYVLLNIGDIRAMAEGERIGGLVSENAGVDDTEAHFNSNMIGMNLCYALFAGYILFFRKNKNYLIRLVVLVVAALVVYLVLMTGSRKSIILLVLPFIVLPFLSKNNGKKMLLIPIAASIVAVGFYLIMYVPILYEVMGSRVEEMINIISGTTTGGEDISRVMLIQYGFEWFLQKPLFGYGINNFRVLSDNTVLFAGRNFYSHNNYIELLVGVGVIGFLIYYSCYFYFWKRLRKHVSGDLLNSWAVVLIIISLFLDIAMVSYYSGIRNLILCICFYAAARTSQRVKINYKNNETNRYYPSM